MASAVAGSNTPAVPAFGRGRGRGRGVRANQATVNPPGPPKPNVTPAAIEEKENEEVTKIMKKLDGKSESEIMKEILPEIEALNNQSVVKDFICALSDKALCSAEFAVIAGKIAHKLWDNETMHSFVRNPLLTRTQDLYNKREVLRKEGKYHGLCVFLCTLFKLLRIKNNPLKPVGGAVVQIIKGLIEESDSPSKEDVTYFYQELESVGAIIGDLFPEKLEEIINLARQMVVSSAIMPSVRCKLVQVIELHAAKWSMNDELRKMYGDLIQELASQGK